MRPTNIKCSEITLCGKKNIALEIPNKSSTRRDYSGGMQQLASRVVYLCRTQAICDNHHKYLPLYVRAFLIIIENIFFLQGPTSLFVEYLYLYMYNYIGKN